MNNIKIGSNLNKKVCASILERFARTYSLQTVSGDVSGSYSILEMGNQSYIIAERNEKLASILINYYQQGKKYHLIIPITTYFILQTISLTSQVDADDIIRHLHLKDPFAVEVSIDDYNMVDNMSIQENEEQLMEYTQIMNDRFGSRKNDIEIDHYNTYLTQYSNYYHLDSEKVIDIAKQLTNNYQNSFGDILSESAMEDYDLYHVIDNPEAASLLFNYFVYRNVIGNEGELAFDISDFGYSKRDLVTTTRIETVDYEKGDETILANGLTRSQLTGKICDLLQMDKYYTLAISYSEAGPNGSPASRNYNNYGGLKNKKGELMKFPSPAAGIAAQALNLKTYPNKHEVDSLEKLWEVYAEKGEDWLPNVKRFYNMITKNPSDYFLETISTVDYQKAPLDIDDSHALDSTDLSYNVDPTFTYNIESQAVKVLKI